MGIILAAEPLVAISNLLVENTAFPLIFAMWWWDRRGLRSWMSIVFLWAFTLMVRLGANIANPLNLYIGQDLSDATLIWLTIYTALGIGFAALGNGWSWFTDACDLLPFHALISGGAGTRKYRTTYKLGDVYYESDPSSAADAQHETRNRFGLPASLRPGWAHFGVTLIAFLLAVGATQVIYTWYMGITGGQLIAWLVDLLAPAAVYALLYGYYRGYGDPYVFGPNEAYLTSKSNNFGLSSDDIERIVQETNGRIAITLGPIAALHFVSVLVLGGVRMGLDDVDINWLAACGLWLALFLVLVVVAIVVRGRRAKREKQTRATRNDGAKGCEDGADDHYAKQATTDTVIPMRAARHQQPALRLQGPQQYQLTYLS